MLDYPVTTCLGIAVHLAVAGNVFDGVFLDEIWDLSQFLRVFLPTLTDLSTKYSSSCVWCKVMRVV